jgi:hypothetical protein
VDAVGGDSGCSDDASNLGLAELHMNNISPG